MKKFSFILAMLLLIMAFGLTFVSCDNGTTSSGTPSVVGVWLHYISDNDQERFEFYPNKTFLFIEDGDHYASGTWEQTGNRVILTFDDDDWQFTGTINNNTLFLQWYMGTIALTRV